MVKPNLDQFTKKICALIATADGLSFEIAGLVLFVKRQFFPDSTFEWLNWTKSKFNYSRRHSFRIARVARFREQLKETTIVSRAELDKIEALGFFRIETLSAIEVENLPQFLELFDIEQMDRDELRDAVDQYLKRVRPAAVQQDFFEQLGLPDPTRLSDAMKKNGAVPVDKAAHYGVVFLHYAAQRQADLSAEDQNALRQHLDRIYLNAWGINVSAVAGRNRG